MGGWIDLSRWVGRLTGVLLVLIFFFGSWDYHIPNPFTLPIEQAMPFISFGIAVAGFVIGWKHEGAGGIFALIGFLMFAVDGFRFVHREFVAPWLPLILLSSVGYLLTWYGIRKNQKENAQYTEPEVEAVVTVPAAPVMRPVVEQPVQQPQAVYIEQPQQQVYVEQPQQAVYIAQPVILVQQPVYEQVVVAPQPQNIMILPPEEPVNPPHQEPPVLELPPQVLKQPERTVHVKPVHELPHDPITHEAIAVPQMVTPHAEPVIVAVQPPVAQDPANDVPLEEDDPDNPAPKKTTSSPFGHWEQQ